MRDFLKATLGCEERYAMLWERIYWTAVFVLLGGIFAGFAWLVYKAW